ncbi:MlaC/ttg2D family ABC transporter substrate-binding protein [Saccharospirillum impatiens]|uniref:MlaC/ttg2D family ABC transporter substrate-binding protein n=1 Tax=Saccharospirillum impatiens TaxID=169438 RepID=UPI000408A105|nr:ABC transporter substrate-binding protein [Saccharospirillum impatiens]
MKQVGIVRALMLIGALLMASQSQAFTPSKSAGQSVMDGVNAVLEVVKKYNGEGGQGSRQAYLDEVGEVLDPLIGYTVIVSRIMGSELLESSSQEQKLRFLEVFKRSMVNTYAGGLYNFGSFDVELLPSENESENSVRNTRVNLNVISPDGQEYPMIQSVYYSREADDWRMQNVIVNGVNLGVTFKSQFDQIYRDSGGDLDATIDEWERTTAESFDEDQFQ